MDAPVGCVHPMFNLTVADKLCHIAMEGVERKYPYSLSLVANSEADMIPHYLLYPSFFGCYDW